MCLITISTGLQEAIYFVPFTVEPTVLFYTRASKQNFLCFFDCGSCKIQYRPIGVEVSGLLCLLRTNEFFYQTFKITE